MDNLDRSATLTATEPIEQSQEATRHRSLRPVIQSGLFKSVMRGIQSQQRSSVDESSSDDRSDSDRDRRQPSEKEDRPCKPVRSHGITETPRRCNKRPDVDDWRVRNPRIPVEKGGDRQTSHDVRDRRRSPISETSESEEEMGFLDIRSLRYNRADRHRSPGRGRPENKAAKHLKNWGVRFENNGRDDPQEFLDDVEACRRAERLRDEDVLEALYGCFGGEAKLWFRNEQFYIRSYREFERVFRKRFMKVATRERLEEDLRGRRQGKDEDVDTYVACMKRILHEFRHPLEMKQQIKAVFRNLKSGYRYYLADKRYNSLEDIVKYGRQYEELLEMEGEDLPPRPAEKMVVKSAAYRPKRTIGKVALVRESEEEEASVDKESPERGKKIGKKKKKQTKTVEKVAATGDNTNSKQCEGKQASSPPLNLEKIMKYLEALGKEAGPKAGVSREERQGKKGDGRPAPNAKTGKCFACGEPGHRVMNCPTKQCYACKKMGHLANKCPSRGQSPRATRPEVSCAWCSYKGVSVTNCPNCAEKYYLLGNGEGGASGPRT